MKYVVSEYVLMDFAKIKWKSLKFCPIRSKIKIGIVERAVAVFYAIAMHSRSYVRRFYVHSALNSRSSRSVWPLYLFSPARTFSFFLPKCIFDSMIFCCSALIAPWKIFTNEHNLRVHFVFLMLNYILYWCVFQWLCVCVLWRTFRFPFSVFPSCSLPTEFVSFFPIVIPVHAYKWMSLRTRVHVCRIHQ